MPRTKEEAKSVVGTWGELASLSKVGVPRGRFKKKRLENERDINSTKSVENRKRTASVHT